MHFAFTKRVVFFKVLIYIFLFHTVTRTLKLGIDVVTGIQLMSDGTLISYGQQADTRSRLFYRLCQHNLETEQLIYSKEMRVQGAIEITFDGKPTLLLFDG